MKTTILFIAIFIGCSLVAQSQQFKLVEDIYRDWHTFSFNKDNNCNFFLFKDSIDIAVIDRAKKRFNKRNVFYKVRTAGEKKLKDSIVFDSSEMRYILEQLDNLNNNKWPENIFSNSKKILPYQVDSMYLSFQGWNVDPNVKLCFNVYTFSHPIFLRDHTLCFFYSEERSFAAREGDFWIYQLKRKIWDRYSPIYFFTKSTP